MAQEATTGHAHAGKARSSNFELLRTLAILLIVIGHCIRQSGLLDSTSGVNRVLAEILGSFLRIGVNVFLLIGCWFMVEKDVPRRRVLNLYLQTAFYTVPLTITMLCIGEAGSMRNVIQGMFPFFGRAVWFVSAYLSLMVLSPYLRPVLSIERSRLRGLLMLLFVLICVVSTIPSSIQIDYMSDFLWFPYVYLLVGFARRERLLSRLPGPLTCLLAAASIYGALVGAKIAGLGGPLPENYLVNIRSIPNFLCALLVFAAFAKLDIGSRPFINAVARPTLAVYVIHQTPAFIDFEWKSIFHSQEWANLPPVGFCLHAIAVGLSLLAGAFFLEYVRRCVFRLASRRRP